jgi:hypothetical protein
MKNLLISFIFKSFILSIILINSTFAPGCKKDLIDLTSTPWEFRLSRSGCRGACPVYAFQIDNNGIMIYDGIRNVKTDSLVILHFTDEQVNKLENLFNSFDYFSFDSSYTSYLVTDLSTVTTSLKYGDKYKKVIHYLGDREAPSQISYFEISVEELLETKNLTGIEPADNYHDFNLE